MSGVDENTWERRALDLGIDIRSASRGLFCAARANLRAKIFWVLFVLLSKVEQWRA